MLVGASEMLVKNEPSELAKTIHQATLRLVKEVAIQRCLSQSEFCDYQTSWIEVTTGQILEEIRSFFANHPVAREKTLIISENYSGLSIKTDISLLLPVLCNMITNALEARRRRYGRINVNNQPQWG